MMAKHLILPFLIVTFVCLIGCAAGSDSSTGPGGTTTSMAS